MNRLSSLTRNLAARYPIEGYGWGSEVARGQIKAQGRKIVITREAGGSGFECSSSSFATQEALRQERIMATVLRLRLPVRQEKPYLHFLTKVDSGSGAVLVGFTPLDKLLGVDPLKYYSDEEYDRFERRFKPEEVYNFRSDDQRALELPSVGGELFYPFSARFVSGRLILNEISYQSDGREEKIVLRAADLGYDHEHAELTMLNKISFALSFPHQVNSRPAATEYHREMAQNGTRWRTELAFVQSEKGVLSELEGAIIRDWSSFAGIINKISEISPAMAR